MASQMEDRRGCFGRHYVSQPMALPMCHREGEQKGRWKRKKSQQQQQQQYRAEQQQHHRWRDMARWKAVDRWMVTIISPVPRPASFPTSRESSPPTSLFPRTPANGEDTVRRRLSSLRRRAITAPRIYTWRLRRDSMRRLMSPTVVIGHIRARIYRYEKCFWFAAKKKEKHARDEFVTFGWRVAIFLTTDLRPSLCRRLLQISLSLSRSRKWDKHAVLKI